jgi:SdpC family antimicrobial peptide
LHLDEENQMMMNRTVAGLAAIVAVSTVGITVPLSPSAAQASEVRSLPSSAVDHESPSYSDDDVVAFFVDGSGPIAADHGDLARRLGFTRGPAGIPADDISALGAELREVIPHFNKRVTLAVTSGDPFRVEAGLRALEDGLRNLGTTSASGDGSGRCAVNVVVAVDVLLVTAAAAAYDQAALWKQNAFWLASADDSGIGAQEIAAAVARSI